MPAPSRSRRGLKIGANRRRAGEDVRAGQSVLGPGAALRPQEIGLAAELGLASVRSSPGCALRSCRPATS